jgi:hypothetical protein
VVEDEDDRRRAIIFAQLAEDVADVTLHRGLGDHQLVGDFLVALTAPDQAQYICGDILACPVSPPARLTRRAD